jgi:hypothetical protein
MSDKPENWLLSERLRALQRALEAAGSEAEAERLWAEADAAVRDAEAEEEAEIALPVWDRDIDAVGRLLRAWDEGKAPLSAWDKAVLKRAFTAFKKRLRLTRIDDSSTSALNPLSHGRDSSIVGVRPPEQYTPDVWAALVRQGKLRDSGGGLLELATV